MSVLSPPFMRKKRRKNRDPNSVSLLKEKADASFSEFIRRRDSGRCFTCGKIKPWKEMQCGHFISRTCEELRFRKVNANCQCFNCNVSNHGEMLIYIRKMEEIHGREFVDELLRVRDQSTKHWKSQELKDIIIYYKDKVDKMS